MHSITMSKQRKYSRWKLLLIALAAFIVSCGLMLMMIARARSRTNGELEAQFAAVVAPHVQLNRGLSLVRAGKPISVSGGSSIAAESVFVLNHTDEGIVFEDQGFGLRLYFAEAANQRWEEVDLQIRYLAEPRVLPPRVTTIGPETNNSLFVDLRWAQITTGARYRIYVEGDGTSTGTKYGAYVDFEYRP